jgi:hypothetical protein
VFKLSAACPANFLEIQAARSKQTIGYTGMSQAAKEVVNGTFLEKYGDKLGNILPEMEQVICELSMPEEIKVLGKKI